MPSKRSEFKRLTNQAIKAARNMGGLIALLLAVENKKTSSILYDPERAAFILNGKILPLTLIRKELGRLEGSLAVLILSYNEKLWRREWTLSKWRDEMAKLVEDSHILFAAFAFGSVAVAVASDLVERRIERDINALGRFATAYKNRQISSLPLMQNRGRAYLRSFTVTHALVDHRQHVNAGYREAKRVLTAAEHCRTKTTENGVLEGCLEAAARGWLPIKQMPPIGTLVCRQFCRCYLIYR